MWTGYITQWIGSRALFDFQMADRGIAQADLHKYLCPMTYRHYEASKRYTKHDVFRMMALNNVTTRSFGKLMERYDLLLTPSLAIRVPKANGPYSLLSDSNDLDGWVNLLADACRFTMPGNETGLPAISVPAGLDANGLPQSVQMGHLDELEYRELVAMIDRLRLQARPPMRTAAAPAPTNVVR